MISTALAWLFADDHSSQFFARGASGCILFTPAPSNCQEVRNTMGFAKFMASLYGRAIRIVAGLVLIAVGLYVQGTWGLVLGVVGAVPLLACAFDICLFAPFFGAPFSGTKMRTRA